MKKSIDDPAGYLERLRPLYVRLFRVAHAVVGNLDVAEYVLKSAIVEAYLRRNEWRDRMGFQECLLHTVKAVALVELKGVKQAGSFEIDWALPAPEKAGNATQEALYERIERESEATQRMAVLYFGCDMAPKQIAQVLGVRASDVSGRLHRLTSRLSRFVKVDARHGRGSLEEQMEWLLLEALGTPGREVPEMGAVFRSFERDVYGARKPRASAGRVVGMAVKVLAALALAALFWLLAVLIQPQASAPRPPDAQAEAEKGAAASKAAAL
ncbi:MAG: hypothetical protein RSJ41_03315 [Clostridia bacterium]